MKSPERTYLQTTAERIPKIRIINRTTSFKTNYLVQLIKRLNELVIHLITSVSKCRRLEGTLARFEEVKITFLPEFASQ